MASESADQESNSAPRRSAWRRVALTLAVFVGAYLLLAYILAPLIWSWYYYRHPALDDSPRITHTSDGHPGDPLNVALVGTETDVKAIMQAAAWHPADKLGLKSDLAIGFDTVLDRPDINAPVSNLFLFGRKEDLAFECPVGDSPKKRNHVRFWKSEKLDTEGRPLWIGAATYDERVGLSHTTGQITHHVAPDVDVERDRLFNALEKTGNLSVTYFVDNYHTVREGKNGGGDPWHTDGRLEVGVIDPRNP
ncbi:MAG: LssY C-terminal domain-containing protein [Pirellulales bacterium]